MNQEKRGKKRIAVTLPDELHTWMETEAQALEMPLATFTGVLIREAKRSRESAQGLAVMLKRMGEMPESDLKALLENEAKRLEKKGG